MAQSGAGSAVAWLVPTGFATLGCAHETAPQSHSRGPTPCSCPSSSRRVARASLLGPGWSDTSGAALCWNAQVGDHGRHEQDGEHGRLDAWTCCRLHEGARDGLCAVLHSGLVRPVRAPCRRSLRGRYSCSICICFAAARCAVEFGLWSCSALRSSDITKATWAAASTRGVLLMAFGGFSNIIGTVFYNRAMQKGSATAVTGLSACYPAVTLLLAMGLIGCVTTALRFEGRALREAQTL